jgi:hypothetical protein
MENSGNGRLPVVEASGSLSVGAVPSGQEAITQPSGKSTGYRPVDFSEGQANAITFLDLMNTTEVEGTPFYPFFTCR